MSYTRTLKPDQQRNVQALKEKGWSATAIGRLYGVSRRTVYRYLEGDLVEATVAGFTTTFYVAPNGTPKRAAPWRKP